MCCYAPSSTPAATHILPHLQYSLVILCFQRDVSNSNSHINTLMGIIFTKISWEYNLQLRPMQKKQLPMTSDYESSSHQSNLSHKTTEPKHDQKDLHYITKTLMRCYLQSSKPITFQLTTYFLNCSKCHIYFVKTLLLSHLVPTFYFYTSENIRNPDDFLIF